MRKIDQQLTRVLGNFRQIRLAMLFGSQATDSATKESDVDLAVLAGEPLTAESKMQIMEAIALEIGQPVDLVDLYTVPEPVLGEVLKGRRILGDVSTQAEILSRHLINAADFLPIQQRILEERRNAWIN